MLAIDKNVPYQETLILPRTSFVENDNGNDNNQTGRAGLTSYYWSNGTDNNETYSSATRQGVKSKRNSAILMSSSTIKEMHQNQNYSSPPMSSGPSQQNNIHNLTINANFMRPIHI